MRRATVIGLRNWVIGCILYVVVVWILNRIFGLISSTAVGAAGFCVMTVMVLQTGSEAFEAGLKARSSAGVDREQTVIKP